MTLASITLLPPNATQRPHIPVLSWGKCTEQLWHWGVIEMLVNKQGAGKYNVTLLRYLRDGILRSTVATKCPASTSCVRTLSSLKISILGPVI
jgi:hypothetical protein